MLKQKNWLQSVGTTIATALVVVTTSTTLLADDGIQTANVKCKDGSVCRIQPTSVPLKVLPRPNSSIYSQMSEDSTLVAPNIPALSPLYVFGREGVDADDADSQEGWYLVSASDEARPLGWMKASDVIEWHNSLILSYTPPGVDDEQRNRVLGFRSFDQLTAVVANEDRETTAGQLIDSLSAMAPGSVPADVLSAGVVSAESEGVFTDIRDSFYMWPILSWAKPQDDPDSDERYVEFIQLVPECRGSIVAKADNEDGSTPKLAAAERGGSLPGMSAGTKENGGMREVSSVEIVFVVDTTASMGPYITSVREGIESAASYISDNLEEGATATFGFVGFRDQFDELGYVVNDFTASGFVNAQEFGKIVGKEVRSADWGDHYLPERLFEGYQAGLNAQWSDDALKFVVVVTDAPGIPESDGSTQSRTSTLVNDDYITLVDTDPYEFDKIVAVSVADAERNGKLAADANIISIVHHIKPGRSYAVDSLAARQLSALVQNDGVDDTYMAVDGRGGSSDSYDQVIKSTASLISAAIGITADTIDESIDQSAEELLAGDTDAEVVEAIEMTMKAVKAAAMDYLGDTESSECDYRGWTTDRDLADSAVRSLEVNTLLTNNELDTLHRTLKDIHSALATGSVTGAGFIDALQSVGTVVLANPQAIEASKSGSLASSGLLPRWLEALPYQSTISALSGDDINAMTSADRTQLAINVSQKIKYYEAVMQDSERWFALSDEDEENPLKKVIPLPLDELP